MATTATAKETATAKSFNLENVDTLVLSGGGLLGISYIGLFQYLEEQNAISRINSITGSSAGALFGCLLAIGYTSKEIHNIIKTINFKEYINITADSLLNFARVKGFESGRQVMTLFKKCIFDKTGKEDITFQEVFEKYKITLKIGVTNLSKSKFQLLDYHNSPNIPIYQAINASIAIPLIFEPIVILGELYCDGGLLDSFPIEYSLPIVSPDCKDKSNVRTLGIYLSNINECLTADNYMDSTIYQYLSCMIHAFNLHPTLCKKENENEKNYKIIIIEIPCDIMTFLKINASYDDIDNIISIAYNTIKKECT
jgi:hypothetical protein